VGADTSSIPRAHLGSILYGGVGISDCKRQGDIAITFDDGPYKYTEDLLDNLSVRQPIYHGPEPSPVHGRQHILTAEL